MSRFAQAFERCRREGRAALMPYMTAGDPSLEWTERLIDAAVEAGADMIELGVPYSDPLADGPTVQAAGQRALAAGVTVDGIFGLVRRVRARYPFAPLGPLGLLQLRLPARGAPIRGGRRCGGRRRADHPRPAAGGGRRRAGRCGRSGDRRDLPRSSYQHAGAHSPDRLPVHGVHLLRLPDGRHRGQKPALGVPGRLFEPGCREVRAAGKKLPLAVGFGISKPEHVAEVSRLADGVIVGSASSTPSTGRRTSRPALKPAAA